MVVRYEHVPGKAQTSIVKSNDTNLRWGQIMIIPVTCSALKHWQCGAERVVHSECSLEIGQAVVLAYMDAKTKSAKFPYRAVEQLERPV